MRPGCSGCQDITVLLELRVETFAGLGTRMRHVPGLLDGDVAHLYADLGVPDYRPRLGRARLTRLLPDFAPAREHPAFRRLLAGGLLSALGGSMTSFAVVLPIWDLSHSSLAVGLLGLTFVPVLVVGLVGGSIADVVDRPRGSAARAAACWPAR